MQLSDAISNTADQDKGKPCELVAPWDGQPTGMVLYVVGPDSATARRADLEYQDELVTLADETGRVNAENRAKAQINALAKKVLRWDVEDDGKPVEFNTKNLLQLLAIGWCREQVDMFAADYRHFGPGK